MVARDSRLRRLTEDVCGRLSRRQLVGSRNVAIEVIALFDAAIEHFADEGRWQTFEHFIEQLSKLGSQLQQAGPKELVIANVVKRIINLLNGEYSGAYLKTLEDASSSPGGSVPPTPSSFGQAPAGANAKVSENAPDFFAHASSDNTRRQASTFSNASFDERNSPRSGSSTPLSLSRAPSMFDLLGHNKPSLLSNQHSHQSSNHSMYQSTTSSHSNTPDYGTPLATSPTISRAPSANFLRSTLGLARMDTSSTIAGEADITAEEDFSRNAHTHKRAFADAIIELLDEVESARSDIALQALDHISAQEMVMTLGHSQTVEEFLKAAAVKRKFTVVVAETAPSYSGKKMAKALANAKIETILVPDACVFALMSRVTKVIVGAHAVLADGSFYGVSGTLPACRAAKVHLKPVIVCTGLYKLCPIFMSDSLLRMDEGSPLEVLGSGTSPDQVEEYDSLENPLAVCNPYYDRVPSDLVGLFITNEGGSPASVCYRLLAELYGPT